MIEWLERELEEKMKSAHVPGLAVGIIEEGQLTYAKGFGMTSVEDGAVPITPDTVFRIGSISKTLTGTAIMRLVERGLIGLDVTIKSYIPWFEVSDKEASSVITVRMLLSHTAGLPTGPTDKNGKRDHGGLEELVRDLPNHPLLFFPGTTWCYSDKGIDTLGYLIEVVTGISFAEAVKEFVFDPLCMNRTTFDPLIAMTYPFAQAHMLEDGELKVIHKAFENTGEYASGFAMSTITDMTEFASMHINEGNWRDEVFLSNDTIREMHKKQANYFMPNESGYGLTFETERYKGIERVWHDGSIGGYCSWMFLAPQQKFGVIMLTNWGLRFWDDAVAIINRLFDERLQLPVSEEAPIFIEPDQSLWPRFVGHYTGPWVGYAEVEVQNDHLVLTWNGERAELQSMKPTHYIGTKDDGDTVSIGFLLKGEQAVTDIMLNGIPCERIMRHREGNMLEAEVFTGVYSSMNDVLTFRIDGSNLICDDKYDQKEYACDRVGDTTFVFDTNLVEFKLGDDGIVTGLYLNKTRFFPNSMSS